MVHCSQNKWKSKNINELPLPKAENVQNMFNIFMRNVNTLSFHYRGCDGHGSGSAQGYPGEPHCEDKCCPGAVVQWPAAGDHWRKKTEGLHLSHSASFPLRLFPKVVAGTNCTHSIINSHLAINLHVFNTYSNVNSLAFKLWFISAGCVYWEFLSDKGQQRRKQWGPSSHEDSA